VDSEVNLEVKGVSFEGSITSETLTPRIGPSYSFSHEPPQVPCCARRGCSSLAIGSWEGVAGLNMLHPRVDGAAFEYENPQSSLIALHWDLG